MVVSVPTAAMDSVEFIKKLMTGLRKGVKYLQEANSGFLSTADISLSLWGENVRIGEGCRIFLFRVLQFTQQ